MKKFVTLGVDAIFSLLDPSEVSKCRTDGTDKTFVDIFLNYTKIEVSEAVKSYVVCVNNSTVTVAGIP